MLCATDAATASIDNVLRIRDIICDTKCVSQKASGISNDNCFKLENNNKQEKKRNKVNYVD